MYHVNLKQEIVDIARKYFPRSAAGYTNSKLNDVWFGDYKDFLQKNAQEFDVIITGTKN
jgi:spermidine synthase